jgi:hypothetical protein
MLAINCSLVLYIKLFRKSLGTKNYSGIITLFFQKC